MERAADSSSDARWRRCVSVDLPVRAGKAAVLAFALTGAALTAVASPAVAKPGVVTPAGAKPTVAKPAGAKPAGAIQPGWNKSSAPQMAKAAAAAKSAAAKKEKAEKAAKAAAAALAALERQQAAQAERLLTAMSSEERQFWSLGAYSVAQNYVQRAEAGSRAASNSVQHAMAVWNASKLNVLKAIRAEKQARATVGVYKKALGELGLAVYTGEAATDINYLGSKERQLAQNELAGVAAVQTSMGLTRSKVALAQSIVKVGQSRATVAVDWGMALEARRALKAAMAQVALSDRDVLVVKLWATVPGAAPDQPVQALGLLEGKLAPHQNGFERPASAGGADPDPASPATVLASSSGGAPHAKSDPPPASLQAMHGYGPSILGPSVLSAADITAWFAATGYHPHVTVPFPQLVADYIKAGQLTGVRADIAFAQSVIETGYFSFPSYGQDAPGFNNFAGIGACNTCKQGWRFPSAMTGVLSQEELLEVYATPPHITAAYGKPATNFGIEGCCLTWMSLAGTWASSPAYGYDILNIYNEMLTWALPRDLAIVGLVPKPAHAPTKPSRPAKSSPAPSRTPQT